MATLYVDANNGSDTNGGTSWQDAFRTIGKAIDSVTDEGTIIKIASGTYLEGEFYLHDSKYHRTVFVGYGDVLIDGHATIPYFADVGGFGANYAIFMNMKFKDFTRASLYIIYGWGRPVAAKCINCTFYCTYRNDLEALCPDILYYYCTIYRYRVANGGSAWSGLRNCIVHGYSGNDYSDCAYINCATPSGRGTDPINTQTYAPPFKDPANYDLSFDPSHTNYSMYIDHGTNHRRVGALFRSGVWYISEVERLRFNDNVVWGSWQNDTRWYDPSWDDVTIDSTNKYIDFEETSGTELTATIAEGTYTSGSDLASAVETALNNAGSNTYTVTFDDTTKRIVINTSGSYLSLLWNSGTNAANSAASALGFDNSSDDTGDTTYTADDALTKGVGVDGETTAAPAYIHPDGYIEIDHGVEPNGESFRVISPVFDIKETHPLKTLGWGETQDSGVIDNSQADATREIEYRADNTPFNATDAPSTTAKDWTLVTDGTEINENYRYIQLRVVGRTNYTT